MFLRVDKFVFSCYFVFTRKGVSLLNYDRIILELLDRVSFLETELKELKAQLVNSSNSETIDDRPLESSYGNKDTTKYMMDGKRYGKNRLALAIVQKYVSLHPNISAQQLMSIFDKSLQGSLGVVRTFEDAKRSYSNSERRFFMQPNEIIRTSTEDCVVCTQWGAFNIDFLVTRAHELGFSITKV